MFRVRQKVRFLGFSEFYDRVEKTQPDGSVLTEPLSCLGSLPSVSNFDLDKLIKAGVPLEQVNTAIIANKSFNLSDSPSEELEQPNNKE